MDRKTKIKNLKFEIETDPKEIEKAHQELKSDKKKWEKTGKKNLEKTKQSMIWDKVNQIIDELIDKKKIQETTFRDATVSYIIAALEKNNLLQKNTFIPIKSKIASQDDIAAKVIDQVIKDLVENQDMIELDSHKNIVDHILERLFR